MAEDDDDVQQPSQEDTPEVPEDRPTYDPESINENAQPEPPIYKDVEDK